ncbi:hypothetical protein H6G97_49105 [Nostoc flagelliforme FACHB-838]|uniref:Uncharacterized protein n=1 Tax=Nostoc flagelliforme FACHB-838 TaxID=2692904 RepID=A0ABR8E647_9NOSO|nr:hypothetical protein [Nostoc flagelliforme FACHB-838]
MINILTQVASYGEERSLWVNKAIKSPPGRNWTLDKKSSSRKLVANTKSRHHKLPQLFFKLSQTELNG